MSLRAAVVVVLAGASQAVAQPAELPPAGYSADSYTDSRGCLFQRATLGDQVIWAERRDATGAPLCDGQPSVVAAPSDALPLIPPSRTGAVPDFPEPGLYLQLGAFSARATADRITTDLQAQGYALLRQDFPRLRVLFAGPFSDSDTAAQARRDLRGKGFPDAFLRRAD